MGPKTALSMLFGAILGGRVLLLCVGRQVVRVSMLLHGERSGELSATVSCTVSSHCTHSAYQQTQFKHAWRAGFGILGPHARSQGWAPGPISDWKNGATGWILWISLAIMLGDSLTSLSLLIISSAKCSK